MAMYFSFPWQTLQCLAAIFLAELTVREADGLQLAAAEISAYGPNRSASSLLHSSAASVNVSNINVTNKSKSMSLLPHNRSSDVRKLALVRTASQSRLNPWVFSIVVSIIPLIFFCFYFMFGSCAGLAAKHAIETWDTSVIGVDVEVDSIHVRLFRGIVEMEGLTIMNPPGFQGPYMVRAGLVHIDVDMTTLKSPTKVLENVVLRQVEVCVEQGREGTNVQQVLAKLQDTDAQEAADETDDLHVQRVAVEDLAVKFVGKLLGRHSSMKLRASDLYWTNFSQQTKTGKAKYILKAFLKQLLKSVMNKAGSVVTTGRNACC
jgi:hypothetical protein